MYLKHFGLRRKPFEQLPDPEFLFLSPKHKAALSSIQFAVAIQDSFVIVTGEIGSGKTTLLHKFLNENLPDAAVAYVTQTRLSDIELLQSILVEFGEVPFGKGKVELTTMLKRFIEGRHRAGGRVVIVVDEAQNLTAEVLEELRLVTCVSPGTTSLVNVVLVGQPQFNRIIDSPALVQLKQRCRLRYHLKALTEEETRQYIEHRLAIAGGSVDKIFDAGLVEMIFQHSRGIPRLINMLCDTALIFASVVESPRVSSENVRHAVIDMGWLESGNRSDSDISQEDLPGAAAQTTLAMLVDSSDGTQYPITDAICVVGRAVNCSVRIKHPALSRYHVMIRKIDNGWTLSDMNSMNGVFLNGRRIRAARLRHNDHVGIGEHGLLFKSEFAEDARPAEAPGESHARTDGTRPGELEEDTYRSSTGRD
jgi:type II secretory pathway predicted ATPase ExeA